MGDYHVNFLTIFINNFFFNFHNFKMKNLPALPFSSKHQAKGHFFL